MSGMRDIQPVLPDGTFYVLEYNGFRFDPAATETLSISINPIQDESKRTIKFLEYNISVRTIVYLSADERLNNVTGQVLASSVDSKIDTILQKLTSQAGQLVFQGKGIGNLNVNVTQNPGGIKDFGIWDVAWGPTPYNVTAKPMADTLAWEIVWNCRVSIPKCDNAKYFDDYMSFNYDIDYSTDYGGYTTRTVRGHIEVPLTRAAQGVRVLTHKDADKFRESIVINIPAGFRDAGGGSFTLSQDRRRLDFQAVHVQLPGIVPPLGVLKCSMSMKTQNHKACNFVSWYFTIDATYEMAAGNFQAVAALHFRRVIVDRLNRLRAIATNPNMKVNAGAGNIPKKPDEPLSDFGAVSRGAAIGALASPPILAPAGAVIGGVLGYYANQQTPAVPTIPNVSPEASYEPGTQTTNNPGWFERNFIAGGQSSQGGGEAQKASVFTEDDMVSKALLPPNCFVAPIFYTAEDPDAYGKPMAKFSCTLTVVGTAYTLLNEGLWEPIKGTPDYNQWKKSLGNIWGPRGSAGLGFDPSEDAIIDLCRPTEGTLRNNTGAATAGINSLTGTQPTGGGTGTIIGTFVPTGTIVGTPVQTGTIIGTPVGSQLRTPNAAPVGTIIGTPAPGENRARSNGWYGQFLRTYWNTTGEEFTSYLGDNLWMTIQNNLTYRQVDDVVKTKKLPTDSALDGVDFYSANTVPDRWFENPGNKFNIQTGGVTIEAQTKFESRVAPDYEITMEGFAIKFGEPAFSPELVSIGGVPCVPIDRIVKVEVVGNSFYPVYRTSWVKKYLLPQHQGRVVDPASAEAASLRSASNAGSSSLNSAGSGGTSSLRSVGA